MESGQSAQWVAVVPVKGNPGAKSRLGDRPDRPRLADAFALDTVAAVLAAPRVGRVLVVTADDALAARLAALGAEIVPEAALPEAALTVEALTVEALPVEARPAEEPTAGAGTGASARSPGGAMNAAIRQGLAVARTRFPRANLLVLTGDLPALTPAEVEHALALAGVPVEPRFGPGSRAAHEAAGHVPLEIPPAAGIRSDVDTAADLLVAERLGLGVHTRPLVAGHSAAPTLR